MTREQEEMAARLLTRWAENPKILDDLITSLQQEPVDWGIQCHECGDEIPDGVFRVTRADGTIACHNCVGFSKDGEQVGGAGDYEPA